MSQKAQHIRRHLSHVKNNSQTLELMLLALAARMLKPNNPAILDDNVKVDIPDPEDILERKQETISDFLHILR